MANQIFKEKNFCEMLEYVRNLNNDGKLAYIVKHYHDANICRLAARQIKDEGFLEDIAKNHHDYKVRRAAVEKISDKDIIEFIAQNDSNDNVRRAATKHINNEEILKEISKIDYIYYVHGILLKFVGDSIYLIQQSSVEEITDIEVLIDIVKDYLSSSSRNPRIKIISDNDELVNFRFDRYFNGYIDNVDFGQINENIFIRLAQNDPNLGVRFISVKKTDNNKEAFIEIRHKRYTKLDFAYAFHNVRDNSMPQDDNNWFGDDEDLIQTALKNPDSLKRENATKHISDESTLIKIAKNDSDKYVRVAAIKNPNLKNESFLTYLAYNAFKFERKQAVLKIRDKEILEDIIKNDPSKHVRKAVLFNRNFNNKSIIIDLAKYDSTDFVRTAARRMLKDNIYQILISYFFGSKI